MMFPRLSAFKTPNRVVFERTGNWPVQSDILLKLYLELQLLIRWYHWRLGKRTGFVSVILLLTSAPWHQYDQTNAGSWKWFKARGLDSTCLPVSVSGGMLESSKAWTTNQRSLSQLFLTAGTVGLGVIYWPMNCIFGNGPAYPQTCPATPPSGRSEHLPVKNYWKFSDMKMFKTGVVIPGNPCCACWELKFNLC